MHSRYAVGDHAGALSAAAAAAPYVHARLSATDMTVRHTTASKSDEQLALEIDALRRRIEAAQAAEVVPNTLLIEAKPEQHAVLRQSAGTLSYEEMPKNAALAAMKKPEDAA